MEDNSKSRRPKILVVDDDDDMRTLLSLSFKRAGLDVTEASNGSEGLQRLSHERFELVVTDVSMPVKDGLTMIAEARILVPKVKFIVHSGSDREILKRVESLSPGSILMVLSKPMPPSAIVAAVKCALLSCECDDQGDAERAEQSQHARPEANPMFRALHKCLHQDDSKVAHWATGKSESRVPRGTPASAGMPARA
ncbi:MAG: response regulator [Candidatus Hydrogenedentes bacterium]|nr:response regulator [Candidatus Hydrogenedentota bacterium]